MADDFFAKLSAEWLTKPAWTDVSIEGPVAVMTVGTFYTLDDYSLSLPTGTVIHKRWRRLVPWNGGSDAQWWMGEYDDSDDPDKVLIHWRKIRIRPGRPGEPDETVDATKGVLDALAAERLLLKVPA
jgi:hypothetical protein